MDPTAAEAKNKFDKAGVDICRETINASHLLKCFMITYISKKEMDCLTHMEKMVKQREKRYACDSSWWEDYLCILGAHFHLHVPR